MYLKKEQRRYLVPFIEQTVKLICKEEDNFVNRAELFGCFVEQLCCLFSLDTDPTFKTHPERQLIETLGELAQSIHVRIVRYDLLEAAEQLKFVVCAVLWGIMGDSMHAKPASSGYRSYLTGVLLEVQARMLTVPHRMNRMVAGVLQDVVQETYRTKTARHEDNQRSRYGHIWPLREITWIESAPIDVSEEFDG